MRRWARPSYQEMRSRRRPTSIKLEWNVRPDRPAAAAAEICERQRLPARAAASGRGVFPNHRPPATRLLADVLEDGHPPRRVRGVVYAAGLRGPDVVAGPPAGRAARPLGGRDWLQYPARRWPSGLFQPPLGR